WWLWPVVRRRKLSFSNLLGAVYRRGNLNFSPDGNCVLSPVGNRITVFNLKQNRSETLPVCAARNIACVALSPDGRLAILVDEEGAALLISLISRSVLHHFDFHKPVRSVRFSPDGRRFVVTKDNVALMYHAPGKTREFNPFVLDKTYFGPYDETTCIDWTDDSKCFVVGSQDASSWVFGAERWLNLVYYAVEGHKDSITACFFEHNSLDLYTLSRDAVLCVWVCDTQLSGLIPPALREGGGDGVEESVGEQVRGRVETERERVGKVQYRRTAKHFFNKEKDFNELTAAAYHKTSHLLVTGFASGIFHLHELPDFNLVHSLCISDQRIASISINTSGDWIAFGCAGLGQLLVWEWQSESYVLKQQGHFNNLTCLSYSPDAQHIATGGEDGKVKVWSTSSGFCFVTFTEHSSSVTAVTFNHTGYVLVSASLDGTVRAFDLHRYRNFRTFTSPQPTQFCCLAVDSSGELVCAGSQDSFQIFVWSMQTGRLLDVMSGHEAPVSGLAFSPQQGLLASASWDHTVRLWEMFDSWKSQETLNLNAEALTVTFRPDGRELAVATLDGQITFWEPRNAVQTGSIETRHDLKVGRRQLDKITAKQAAKGKAVSTLCYSADGSSVLAGGHSRFVCVYNVREQILMKKFEISCNLSLDAMEEWLDRRKMTDFGSTALIDDGADDEEGVAISLPGVRTGTGLS
ncbi:PWP2 small subunit processome component, partial [Callorhinchus milii]|uniref:PWP2 small subunit processome component n=1 Tax=Callorhinchus milii TaxID=7868 RepID=UPI001C3FE2D9